MSFASAQDLEYFVEMAKENHPLLTSKSADYEAERTKIKQVSALKDPVLSAGYNVLSEGMEKAKVSLMQNFSWFGTAKHQRAVAKAGAQSVAYDLEALKKQIEVDISQLYYELQAAGKTLKVKQEYLEVYRALEEIANDNVETSNGSMADVIRVQVKKYAAQSDIKKLRLKQENISYAINKLVGRNYSDTIIVKPVTYKPVEITVDSIENHPEIEAIDAKIEQSNELTKAVHKSSLPQLGIGVEYMRMNPSGNELMPMISVSVPIFRKKYKAQKKETEWRKKSLEAQKEWKEDEFYRERNQLESELEAAEIERESLYKQQQKIEEVYRLTLNYYSTSGKEFKDVLELKEEELAFQVDLIENNTKLLKLVKQIEYYKINTDEK